MARVASSRGSLPEHAPRGMCASWARCRPQGSTPCGCIAFISRRVLEHTPRGLVASWARAGLDTVLSARCIHLEARARAHASWVCSIRSTVPPAGLDTAHAGNRLRPQSTAGALLSLPHAVAEFAATPLQVATRSACGLCGRMHLRHSRASSWRGPSLPTSWQGCSSFEV